MLKSNKNRIKHVFITTCVFLGMSFSLVAHAGSDYYVYKNAANCEVSLKSPENINKDNNWKYVGKEASRSDAKKKAKLVGCTSY